MGEREFRTARLRAEQTCDRRSAPAEITFILEIKLSQQALSSDAPYLRVKILL